MTKRTLSASISLLAAIALITCVNGCQTDSRQSSSAHEAVQSGAEKSYLEEVRYPRDWKEIASRREQLEEDELAGLRQSLLRSGNAMPAEMNVMSDKMGSLLPDLLTVSEDELWVIVRSPEQQKSTDDHPGSGAMLACFPDGRDPIPFPLMHTEVSASITGYIASVDVTQQFHNPYVEKIEAEYVFPLPQNAAINEFIMQIGSRSIRGIIRARQEAEQIYQQAKSQGYTASLLTQERPNVFTQKVANIESQQSIHVRIHYFNTLVYIDGWYEFAFPMVVGPRFNPPHQADGIGAVELGAQGASGQSTEIQYLAPGQRSGHDIALSLTVNAGAKIEAVECRSHDIIKQSHDSECITVSLDPRDSIPNKDFVLRYRIAGDSVKSALLADSDQNGSYFTLMLYPPRELSLLDRAPVEMFFVMDCSGSMDGEPIRKSKVAVRRALNKLRPDDTFQIIRFSESASSLGHYPVSATPENIQRGLKYVNSLESEGGTMMMNGIKAALDYPHDARRVRLVSFMTDGYIGNEAEILAAIKPRLGRARIFSFGVGSSVNRYLLDRMAKLGSGAVAYIGLHDNPNAAIDAFYDRVCHPALTDISIDWGSLQVAEVYPSQIPDLFVGRPVIVTGRFSGSLPAAIQLTGRAGAGQRRLTVPVIDDAIPQAQSGISYIWARKKIEDLALRSLNKTKPILIDQIKQTSLDYGLMSAFTAFVAVDSSHRTEGDRGVSVKVPVPMPEGVNYDTTVPSGQQEVIN